MASELALKTNTLVAACVLDATLPDNRQRMIGDDLLGAKLKFVNKKVEADLLLANLERRGNCLTNYCKIGNYESS